MKYEKFLDRVRENSDEFNEVSDIIHRYETLNKENKKMDQTHKDLEESGLDAAHRRCRRRVGGITAKPETA